MVYFNEFDSMKPKIIKNCLALVSNVLYKYLDEHRGISIQFKTNWIDAFTLKLSYLVSPIHSKILSINFIFAFICRCFSPV